MSELSLYKKRNDHERISIDSEIFKKYLVIKRNFIDNHIKAMKTIITQYSLNQKTIEQQKALEGEIILLSNNTKGKITQLKEEIDMLQSIEIEKKCKIINQLFNISINDSKIMTDMQHKNALLKEKFLIKNNIMEKEAYIYQLKGDLDHIKKFSFFKEIKRNIYIPNIKKSYFDKSYDSMNQSQQNKIKERKEKKKSILSSLLVNMKAQLKELKTKAYRKKVNEGYIWKTINTKFQKEITINMMEMTSDTNSNCSSNSEDRFSFDGFHTEEEDENEGDEFSKVSSPLKNDKDNFSSKMLDDHNFHKTITPLFPSKKYFHSTANLCHNSIILPTNDNYNGISCISPKPTISSMAISNEFDDESECNILRTKVHILKQSNKLLLQKIIKYQIHQKKMKHHINFLLLRISLSDFMPIEQHNSYKRKTMPFAKTNWFLLDSNE